MTQMDGRLGSTRKPYLAGSKPARGTKLKLNKAMTDPEITFEHVLPQIHHTCIFGHDTYHRYSPTDWQQVWVGTEYPVKPEMIEKLEKAFQKFRYS